LPFLFSAARASFAASWKLAALAETFGGTTGVGVQIRKAFQGFAVADMLAWMMFFVIFVVVVERLVLIPLERHAFRYRLQRSEDVLRY
jgi:NitT/TauT family transport system permease protein